MSAGGLNKLPFGNMPRLLLAWVCTEVVHGPKAVYSSWDLRYPISCGSWRFTLKAADATEYERGSAIR